MSRRALGACALLAALSLGPAPGAAQAPEPASEAAAEAVVNVNTASAEQLMRVPGIGAVRAQAIIDARERRPFRRTRELIARVHGIGRATYRRIARYLTVEGPTTLGE